MTFKEKIANSRVIDEGLVEKGKRVSTRKQRIFNLLLSLVLVAYSIYNVYKNYRKYDFSSWENLTQRINNITFIVFLALLVFKVVYSFIMALMKKTITALNHYKFLTILTFLNDFNLFLIFVFNMNITIDYLTKIGLYSNKEMFFTNLGNLWNEDKGQFLSLVLGIVVNIPILIKFLRFAIKNIVPLMFSGIFFIMAPITLFKFLFVDDRLFYQYENYDANYYLVRLRKIEKRGYRLTQFAKRLLAFLFLSAACMGVGLSVSFSIGNESKLMVGLIIGGFLIAYAINFISYMSKKLKKVEKLNKKEFRRSIRRDNDNSQTVVTNNIN